MSDTDTLCFADADGVTGNPTIDGFFFTDAGVLTSEAEPGYVGGSRMTFGGAGFPPVVFQGVRDTGTGSLVFAFLCRLDRTFDPRDVVVLALRPTAGAGDQARRRIDIFPSFLDVGADDPGPAGDPDDAPPGVPMGDDYHIRGDHPPQAINFYRADNSAAPWTPYSPLLAPPYEVKVRSWRPIGGGLPNEAAWSIEIRVPVSTAAGNTDWINLSPAGFGLYFSVVRIGQDVAAGPDVVDDYYATQFRFPVAPGNALTGYLDTTLQIDPSWYGTGLIPALQVPAQSNLGQGVRFLDGAMGVGCRKPSTGSALSHEISNTEDNQLVSILQNTGTTTANNVTAEIRLANWGLGPPDFSAWARPLGIDPANPNPSLPITVPSGGGPAEAHSTWLAGTIPAAYAAHKHQCIWVQLSSSSAVNFAQSSVRRNMDFINLSEVERPAEVSGVGYPPPKDGGKTHDFLLFTHVRKVRVRDLIGRDVVLGDEMTAFATGALQQPGGESQADKLEKLSTGVGNQQQWKDTVLYLWITEGYRRTGQTLTIGKIKAEVLDEGPGAFGYVARHEGVDDPFSWSFEGPGLTRRRPGVHSLEVPHGGATTVKVKLRADKEGPRGDVSEDPRVKGPGLGGPDDGPSGVGSSGDGPTAAAVETWVKRHFKWWWLLVLLIILLLILLMR